MKTTVVMHRGVRPSGKRPTRTTAMTSAVLGRKRCRWVTVESSDCWRPSLGFASSTLCADSDNTSKVSICFDYQAKGE